MSGILTQPPVVLGHRLLIAGRNCIGFPGARIGRGFIALQLELQLVDGAEQLTVHLLHHRRIAGEAAGIEALHLPLQVGHILRGLGIVVDHLAELVQIAHPLLDGALGVRGIA